MNACPRGRYPVLFDPALNGRPLPDGHDHHQVVGPWLERVIRRGQRTGDFDRALPAAWLAAAIFGLGHTAAEQVAAGRLTTSKAAALLLDSALRLCGPPAPRAGHPKAPHAQG